MSTCLMSLIKYYKAPTNLSSTYTDEELGRKVLHVGIEANNGLG